MKFFEKRRARKARLLEEVKANKAVQARKEAEIASLSKEEQKLAKQELKNQKKADKKAFKASLKDMSRKEKRAAKKEAKVYKKLYNRKPRAIAWGITGVVVALLIVQFGPYAVDMAQIVSGQDITVDSHSPQAVAAREFGDALSKEIVEEGIVLLKNEDNNLPLNGRKLNVFGVSAHNFRYGGGGSGAADTSRAVNLFDALNDENIEVNPELQDFYSKIADGSLDDDKGFMQVLKGFTGETDPDEPAIDHLSDDMISQAKEFSQDALLVITSSGTEASDMTLEQLQLSDNKRDLIQKVSDNFENVTIVINAGNAIELGFLEEFPNVKSALWVGTPGPYGTRSLAEVLKGDINPSGRLTDTYAYDASSSPASVNFGDYKYENYDKAFMNYQEGIYVGYRFYETYYQNDEAGYQAAVQYPFGHGLSYTDFEWNVVASDLNKDTMNLEVQVKNTGTLSGKDVVQVYYSAPYLENGLEKSAINLAAYAKTKELNPGESQTLSLSFDTRDMASYDMTNAAYVLDEGVYEVKVARNVHDIVDTLNYTSEKVLYKTNSKTDAAYENRFEDASGDIEFLSRSDFDATFPNDQTISHLASDQLLEAVKKVDVPTDLVMPEFDVNHDLMLKDLKGLDFNDPKWDLFLEQFSLDELIELVSYGAYKTEGFEAYGVPKTLLMDGPAGYSYFFTDVIAAAYPSELLVASTWNDDLAYRMGESSGKEARAYGIQGWYAPAMNLHRTPQGGRNFEYFSEDPLISGKIGAAITRGAQDQGIIVFMKHFAMNDQEANARSGIHLWATEQAIRELYLKPFEITVKEADVLGVMSSFSYIGEKWAGANSDLLYGVLREEWGFDGFVSSDAVFGFMKADAAIVNGNDLMLDLISPYGNTKDLKKAYKENPEWIANGLKDSAHHIFYTILKTYLFE